MAYIKLEDLQKFPIRVDHYDKENGNLDFVLGIESVIEYAECLTAADLEEVKHGEWKQGIPYVCSICGKPAPDEKNTSEKYSCWTSPYCPHCGAKMDGRSDT